jgi:hypothetical protein
MQQCPSAASAGTTATAAVAATTTGKLQVMAATHSTLSLPDHQAAAAQEKAEEVERWGMMQMGHAGMGGCAHKLPVTSMRLSSSNVPRQFCSVQGGLSLMMNPPLKGEESAAPTTAEACTTATTATPDALQRVHEVSHTASSRGVVVGVFLPEEQCMKKKQELLPLAASSSPSSSSSSICDGREQSSCSSQGSEFGGDLPANEVTWPELAHQYLVTLIQVKKSGYPSGLRPEERKRFIRCLQRDGGVLFGAAATVVAVESDAQVMMWFWCGLYVRCSMFTIIG